MSRFANRGFVATFVPGAFQNGDSWWSQNCNQHCFSI